MKVKIFFAWYDFWIGWYWDRKKKVLYICLLPMIVIQLKKDKRMAYFTNEQKRQLKEAIEFSISMCIFLILFYGILALIFLIFKPT